MYLALKKYNNNRKILTTILVPDFCPLKPEIARFSIGFRLNLFLMIFPHMSLHYKLVPVQCRKYEYGLLANQLRSQGLSSYRPSPRSLQGR